MSEIDPQPKKLTLEQALDVTRKPLKRMGDLVIVQVHNQLRSHPNFPNGEMRGTFMPARPNLNEKFKRHFIQPDTENYLRELYQNDGFIESLVKFSDEALALKFDYRGGFFRDNSFAGDVGDPSRFVVDFTESLDQHVEPRRDVVEAIRQTVLRQHKKDRLAASLGIQHSANQKKFREDKQKLDDEKHDQWRNWQASEKISNSQFAKQSKQNQAKRLKKKYAIPDKSETVAKQLEPLPPPKK